MYKSTFIDGVASLYHLDTTREVIAKEALLDGVVQFNIGPSDVAFKNASEAPRRIVHFNSADGLKGEDSCVRLKIIFVEVN